MHKKYVGLFAALLLSASFGTKALDVGVSVEIGDPNFYGRIDIGDFPRPRVIYPEPVVIVPGPARPPVYLRVPPGHAKDWRKHCARYDACGRPVYFVDDDWYSREYAPAYREKHSKGPKDRGPKDHPGKGKGKDKH